MGQIFGSFIGVLSPTGVLDKFSVFRGTHGIDTGFNFTAVLDQFSGIREVTDKGNCRGSRQRRVDAVTFSGIPDRVDTVSDSASTGNEPDKIEPGMSKAFNILRIPKTWGTGRTTPTGGRRVLKTSRTTDNPTHTRNTLTSLGQVRPWTGGVCGDRAGYGMVSVDGRPGRRMRGRRRGSRNAAVPGRGRS
jgi:hypothetical protein